MAVRDFEFSENIVVDVNTETYYYQDCDVPNNPINHDLQSISFWYEDKLMIVPMSRVKSLRFYHKEIRGSNGGA